MLLSTMVFAAPVAAQDPKPPRDVRSELKETMKARYPLLEKLRDNGKVGETGNGEVKLVKDAYGTEKADPADKKSSTIAEVVEAENRDRQALYELLAKELKLTAKEVSLQNGARNLDKAKPDQMVEVKGEWVQRKAVTPQKQEGK
ncbi:MAG: YdbL family protein [Planctomycetes bacterium]|nr:YdbL family protein [Planctomycetota bacterium]